MREGCQGDATACSLLSEQTPCFPFLCPLSCAEELVRAQCRARQHGAAFCIPATPHDPVQTQRWITHCWWAGITACLCFVLHKHRFSRKKRIAHSLVKVSMRKALILFAWSVWISGTSQKLLWDAGLMILQFNTAFYSRVRKWSTFSVCDELLLEKPAARVLATGSGSQARHVWLGQGINGLGLIAGCRACWGSSAAITGGYWIVLPADLIAVLEIVKA